VRDAANPDRSIAATFQALPGASFVVNGAAQARDSALTTASLETMRAASDLRFQCKSDAQRDLVMANRPILDMAARLHDLEPLHLANGLGRAPDGVLDRVLNRFF
jgi:hypothetical protein